MYGMNPLDKERETLMSSLQTLAEDLKDETEDEKNEDAMALPSSILSKEELKLSKEEQLDLLLKAQEDKAQEYYLSKMKLEEQSRKLMQAMEEYEYNVPVKT